MSAQSEFLRSLFADGKAVLRDPPAGASRQDQEAAAVLENAYASYRLGVAGPPLRFDAATALAAADLVQHACWFLVSHQQPDAELERILKMPGPPRTPEQHLSADLVLRYLPQVYQRARALNPADRLTGLLADVLRQWPLSGVLSAVEEGPTTPPDFGRPGLALLYAERLARHDKPAWLPDGTGFGYVELVWQELGKDVAALERRRAAAAHGAAEGGDGA